MAESVTRGECDFVAIMWPRRTWLRSEVPMWGKGWDERRLRAGEVEVGVTEVKIPEQSSPQTVRRYSSWGR